MVSYTGYGQFPECVETEDDRGSNTTTVWNNFCEVDFQYDDVASTSVDELDASTSNFHDIAVTQVVVAQGYATETSDNPTFLRDGTSTIDVGFSRLHATVEHRGTTPSKTYDWTVQFVVTDESDGSTTTYDANECATGVPPPYQHAVLGEAEPPTDPSQPPVLSSIVGYACVAHTFGPGDYGITATISMVNSDVTDMKGSNDMGGINVQAVNNAPTVTLTRTNTDVNVVFSEDPTPFTDASMTKGPVMFTADCLDADDLSGTSLTYAWEHGSNAIEGAGGMGPQASALPMDIRAEHVGTDYVTVTCTDEYGATANAQVSLEVWNSALAVGQAGDITLEYDLIFDGPAYAVGLVASTQAFSTVPTNALSDNNLASTSNLPVLQAYDFTPSTTWNELLLNEFSVTFDPNTVAATSLWMVDTNNDWVRLGRRRRRGINDCEQCELHRDARLDESHPESRDLAPGRRRSRRSSGAIRKRQWHDRRGRSGRRHPDLHDQDGNDGRWRRMGPSWMWPLAHRARRPMQKSSRGSPRVRIRWTSPTVAV